jgi:ABC-type nitrate/sulfonate/bicarbonate transport system permease component
VGVAVLLDISVWIRRAVYPLLIASQTVPTIALAPLLLLWFGFGILPKVIIVVLCCFFPITIATLGGFASVERSYLHLLQSMRATYWQSLWYVKLPGSLPQFFAGLKVAVTYSVTGAVVGEYVGAYQGLGIYMQMVAHSYAIVLVFAVIIVISTLSLCLFLLVIWLERIFVPWKR